MTKDHLIPAALLGQFSPSVQGSARKRQVWRALRGQKAPVQRRAESIGYIENYYSIKTPGLDVREVDDSWAPYERGIPAALDELRNLGVYGLYDAWTWLHVLVPLLAGMWVRGEPFAHGKEVTLWDEDGAPSHPDPKSNLNFARRAEQARLLAPLMTANWELVHFPHGQLITSDQGFTVIKATMDQGGYPAMAVPIDPHRALIVHRRDQGNVAYAHDDKWVTIITPRTAPPGAAEALNDAVAQSAHKFIVGATPELVRRVAKTAFAVPYVNHDLHLMWAETDQRLGLNQAEWFTLRQVLTWPPDNRVHIQHGLLERNPAKKIENQWWPQYIYAVGRPPALSAISKHGGVIASDLTHVWDVHQALDTLHNGSPSPITARPGNHPYPVRDEVTAPLIEHEIATRVFGPAPPDQDQPRPLPLDVKMP